MSRNERPTVYVVLSPLLTYSLRCLVVMEFHVDALLCSNLGNQNSDAGHIKK